MCKSCKREQVQHEGNNPFFKTRSPATEPTTGRTAKGKSKNQRYEQKRKAKGEKKITIWVPEEFMNEFRLMAEYCCEHKHYFPFMARNAETGKMAKAVH